MDLINNVTLMNAPVRNLALIDMPFMNIVIQDGPYCPKSCSICYGNFGPTKPKASVRLYEEVMKQLPDTDISHVIITDGEICHDIDRLENIITLLDGMPVELNTNGTFAKTLDDAESTLYRLKSLGMTFERQPLRAIDGTTNSTIALSADQYHGEESYGYALNTLIAFHNVFKDISVKNVRGKHHDTNYHVAVAGVYGKDSSVKETFKKLDEKIVKPLQKVIPKNIYEHLCPEVGYFVTDNLAAHIIASSMVSEGGAKKLFPEDTKPKKIFNPKKALPPFPEAPALYLKSSGDVYNVISYHCAVPGRFLGNIFEEPMSEIIHRTMTQPVYQMERERGVRGIYDWLYARGVKIKANSHCDLCKEIFEDKETIDTFNTLLSESWSRYVDKLKS
jgi:hypothetical protein